MSILITGASGQLGSEFCKIFSSSIGKTRSELDICDFNKTKKLLNEVKPKILINCAAYTAVDLAEEKKIDCFLINSEAVLNLSKICEEIKCFFVNISSDYVFGQDELRKKPYKETDLPSPVNIYGESKVKGEEFTRICEKHLIIRTCGLFSANSSGPVKGRNFLDTMLCLSKDKSELSIIDDQFCTPSYVPHVAIGIKKLIENNCIGTFNVVNRGFTNWFDFASELFNKAQIKTKTNRIKSKDYKCKAERPKYSVLCTEKTDSVIKLPDWQNAIQDYLSLIM
jgi:dTDP-4-dehydrorhamnose reductase